MDGAARRGRLRHLGMSTATPPTIRPLELLREQRSHVLLVLSNPKVGADRTFRSWYLGAYQQEILALAPVLRGQQYEPHELDVSRGKYPGLPVRYLGIYDISVDGAQAAVGVIERVRELHGRETSAAAPATWLYYPVSERVGRSPTALPSLLTLAFANAVPGQEAEFREWYATRHIRHALNIPALISGQCFERSQFQSPGALAADYSMIAVYEQEGTPDEMMRSFHSLPPGTLDFPAMDLAPGRFAEWVYRPLPSEAR
jgi:hypothetical protein